jgi:hypothetical protein
MDLSTVGRMFILVFVVGMLIVASYHKTKFVYRDDSKSNLIAQFTHPKLRGIKSTPRNVSQIEGLIAATDKYTDEDDFVIIFPDIPIFYYLADRRNPGPIDWYYRYEFNLEMLEMAQKQIDKNRPQLIIIQKYNEGDYLRTGATYPYTDPSNRYYYMYRYIEDFYQPVEMVGDILFTIPKDSI